jgi:hypothetical protein
LRYIPFTYPQKRKDFPKEVANHINKDFPGCADVFNNGTGWFVGITESYWKECCKYVKDLHEGRIKRVAA